MDWLGAFSVLNPHGAVGLAERGLMVHAVLFMLIVAVPVYALLFFFAWRYRDRGAEKTIANQKDGPLYTPDWEHAKVDELIWWAIPFEIVLVLGALTWTSTHELDPRVPLEGGEPLVVQVVALDWKWLFIYPAQNIATVNYLEIPVGKPVKFEITADAPVNAFWIPQLGGQIYAMTGMVTTLNLVADTPGVYAGGSSNYSGEGFAHMKFDTHAVAKDDFDAWVRKTQSLSGSLKSASYATLAEASVEEQPLYYGDVEPELFEDIVSRFMSGMSPHEDMEHHH
jgi:cytochrome o ubiquinol oxidase subunit 2